MHVLIVGGTGFLGRRLVDALRARGDEVMVASRKPQSVAHAFGQGVASCGITEAELAEGADGRHAVINLAGAGIFDHRWTEQYKREIWSSRVDMAGSVVRALGALPHDRRPGVLVNASAVGYYGDRGEEDLTETSPPGKDFLATLCKDWEEAARTAEERDVRVTLLRTGIVLAKSGGALQRIALPHRLFVGGPIGSGRQWTSWVHVADAVGLTLHLLDEPIAGPVNVTSPQPVRMSELCAAVGRELNRPSWLPVPLPLLRLAVGDVADMLVSSAKVHPTRAQASYTFRFPHLAPALSDLLG